MTRQPNDRSPAATPAPPAAPTDPSDRDEVEVRRFPDGSREVRPDDDKQTGQAPPEDIGGADGDGVAETTRGDTGGAS